jgi:hypothetical protein
MYTPRQLLFCLFCCPSACLGRCLSIRNESLLPRMTMARPDVALPLTQNDRRFSDLTSHNNRSSHPLRHQSFSSCQPKPLLLPSIVDQVQVLSHLCSNTITENVGSSEEKCPHKLGTTQANFDLAHPQIVLDLGDTHSQAHKLSDPVGQELSEILRNRRRSDSHIEHTSGEGPAIRSTPLY